MTSVSPSSLSQFTPILAVQFIGTLGYSVAIPFLVFLVSDFGGAPWTYGLVGATYSACQLIGAPILGRWSDRVGRTRVLILSQAGTLVAWILFLVALFVPRATLGEWAGAVITVPLVMVFVARALDGLTGGNISVANAYVADLTRRQTGEGDAGVRRRAFGRMAMAASLGFVLGPALAGLLGSTPWGYVGPVGGAALISFAALVLCMRLREPQGPCPRGPPDQPAVSRILGQQQIRCDRPIPNAPSVVYSPLVVALLWATFLQFLAFNLFYAGFPVHAAESLGWDAGQMGLFFSGMSGVMIVAQGPLLSWTSERVSAPALFMVGILLLMGAFIAFLQSTSATAFAGAALFAVGNGLAWPTFQARLADVAGPEAQGAVQGASTSVGSLAGIIGLVVGGLLFPKLGVLLFGFGAVLFGAVAAATPVWFRTWADPGVAPNRRG